MKNRYRQSKVNVNLNKEISKARKYAEQCKAYSGKAWSKRVADTMQARLDIVNNPNVNCFDKLRQLFTERRYELGMWRVKLGKELYEEDIAYRMSFNFTVKLINEIVRFDTIEKLEEKTIYSRITDKYRVFLDVEVYRMELKVFEDGELILHRTCGDGIHAKEEYYSTQMPEMIRKSKELGILYFGNGGRSDVVEYHYQIEDLEEYRRVYVKFKKFIQEKGMVRLLEWDNNIKQVAGQWTLYTKNKALILRTSSINVTFHELQEVALMFNDFLKSEGHTEKNDDYIFYGRL